MAKWDRGREGGGSEGLLDYKGLDAPGGCRRWVSALGTIERLRIPVLSWR